MTVTELAEFVKQRRKKQIDDHKSIAEAAYVSGLLGSMSLQKYRPRFEDIFDFPEEKKKGFDAEKSKQLMLAYAANLNRQVPRLLKEGSDSDG